MSAKKKAIEALDKWYRNLPVLKQTGGPARGTIAAALVVLEHLKEKFDLKLESHRASSGKSQIAGLNASAVAKILEKFDEERPFLKEGGRTNRGGPGAIEDMLSTIDGVGLDKLKATERTKILETLQAYMVEKVREYHNRQRLKLAHDPSATTREMIRDLLSNAKATGKEGPVAQYLIGAKLAIRFPGIKISNESYSTADDQLGRPGDFCVQDTAFHVTVAPMSGVYEKCKDNIKNGYRVYLLVPERILQAARENAESTVPGKIAVESIESFVGQNIEELSYFSKPELRKRILNLLETYNARVDKAENDKSLMIEIPRNLTQ